MKEHPKIESERLVIDQIKVDDAPLAAKYAGDRKISQFYLEIPHPISEADALEWIKFTHEDFEKNGNYFFGIYLKSTREFIGSITLGMNSHHKRAALGYWLGLPFWNKGYATEAAKAIIDFGFKSLKLNKIYASYMVQNIASKNVMERVGMVKEGTFADHDLVDGEYRTLEQYRILKREFDS